MLMLLNAGDGTMDRLATAEESLVFEEFDGAIDGATAVSLVCVEFDGASNEIAVDSLPCEDLDGAIDGTTLDSLLCENFNGAINGTTLASLLYKDFDEASVGIFVESIVELWLMIMMLLFFLTLSSFDSSFSSCLETDVSVAE